MTLRNGSPTTLSNLAFELVDIELPPWKLNAESCLSPAWKPEPPHGLSSLPRMTSEKSKPFHSSGGEIVKSLSYSGSFSLSNEAFKVVLALLIQNQRQYSEATVRATVQKPSEKELCRKVQPSLNIEFFLLDSDQQSLQQQ